MLFCGIAEVDITPDHPLRVAGMLTPPVVETAVWPLFGRVFLFKYDEQQAALVVLDNLLLAPALVQPLRETITRGAGITPCQVMISCTHTHRAPYAAALMDEEIDFAYIDWMGERLATCLARALADLQPAQIKTGSIQAPGWTFNRRQVYRSAQYGEQVGTQGPQNTPDFIGNEGPEDNELKVLKITSPQGAGRGGMVNFACHTTVMGGEAVFSADYAGPLTEALSRQLGGIFAFLQGAAGNLWAIDTSREQAELAHDFVGPDHALKMGEALAQKAVEALADAHPVSSSLRIAREILPIPQRRVTRKQVELAQWYLEKAPVDLDQQEFTRQIYGHDYTFYGNDAVVQEWFARETIGMWEWQRRSGVREIIEEVEIQVLRLGDAVLVGLPGEVFTEFGLEIKARSPFRETFIVELANGWHGYIPTRAAFAHGGYEPRFGYTSRLVPEAGERMVEAALRLLHSLIRE